MYVYHAVHIYMYVHIHAIAFSSFYFPYNKQFLNNQNTFTLKIV